MKKKVISTIEEQDARTTPFETLKANIRAMVAEYVSKNGQMSEAEYASLNGMSCLHYDYSGR